MNYGMVKSERLSWHRNGVPVDGDVLNDYLPVYFNTFANSYLGDDTEGYGVALDGKPLREGDRLIVHYSEGPPLLGRISIMSGLTKALEDLDSKELHTIGMNWQDAIDDPEEKDAMWALLASMMYMVWRVTEHV